MDQKMIVVLVLGVLITISLVQSFQLSAINGLVSSGDLSLESSSSSVSSSPASGSGQSSLPSNIKDLPQMVGGC